MLYSEPGFAFLGVTISKKDQVSPQRVRPRI